MGNERNTGRIALIGIVSVVLGAASLYMFAMRIRATLWGIGRFEGWVTFLGFAMAVMFGIMGLVCVLVGILYLFSLKH